MPTINPVSTIQQPALNDVQRNIGTVSEQGVGSALLQFANVATKKQMKEEASRQYLEGQQQIAQGSSLQEVKDNQDSFLSLFGETASVRGARALDTEVAIDQMFRDEMSAMPENASLNPEAYAKVQQDRLTQIVGGIDDEKQAAAVTIAYAKKAAELSGSHLKAHTKYVDATTRKAYQKAVLSKAENVQLSVDTEHGEAAQAELIQALSQPKGMSTDAYNASLTESITSSLAGGNGSIYNAVFQSPVFDNLSPKQQTEIYTARSKYEREQLKEHSIEVGKSQAVIDAYVESPEGTVPKLLELLQEHKAKYGLSPEKVTTALNKLRKTSKLSSDTLDLAELARTRQFSTMKPKEQQEALNTMRQEWGEDYPKYWGEVSITDKRKSSEWTNGFGNMTTAEGLIDPRFTDTFSDFQQFYAVDPSRAMAHIQDDDTKIRVQSILDRVASDGDVEAAVRGRNLVEQNAGNMTPERTENLTEAVEDVMSDGIFTEYNDFNAPYISAQMTRRAKQLMANGRTNADVAVKLAQQEFEQSHDLVKGDYVPNGGTKMRDRLGLTKDQTVDGVLDNFVDSNRADLFGAHEGDYRTVVNVGGNTLTLIPLDENSQPLAGGFPLSLDALKSLNVMNVAKEQELQLAAKRASADQSVEANIRTRQIQAARMGQTLSHDQALEAINTSERRAQTVKKVVGGEMINAMGVIKDLGASWDAFSDMFKTDATIAQKETQKANDTAAAHGVALPTKVAMGWGTESLRAAGGSPEIGKLLDVFAMTESDAGQARANPTSSARGVFQYMTKGLEGGNNAMQTAATRVLRQMQEEGAPVPKWALRMATAADGSNEDREQFMLTLDDDASGAMLLWEMKSNPWTNELLEKAKHGDKESVRELYYKYHHTNPDAQTTQLFERNLTHIYGE